VHLAAEQLDVAVLEAWTAPKLFCVLRERGSGSGCVVVKTVAGEGALAIARPPRLLVLELELVDVLDRERKRRPRITCGRLSGPLMILLLAELALA